MNTLKVVNRIVTIGILAFCGVAHADPVAFRLTPNPLFLVANDGPINDPFQSYSPMTCLDPAGNAGGNAAELIECGTFRKVTDFSGKNLVKARIRGLHGAGFPGAKISFKEANLEDADLTGIYDAEFDFTDARLRNANLSYARARRNARFDGADLKSAFMQYANFAFSSFRGASLIEANLVDAGIGGADFTGADLSKANLRGTDCDRTNFTNANLTGAKFNTNSSLYDAVLKDANLRGVLAVGVSFGSAVLTKADLSGADLREADLRQANLSSATVDSQTQLQGAKFSKHTRLPFSQEEALTRGMICVGVCE